MARDELSPTRRAFLGGVAAATVAGFGLPAVLLEAPGHDDAGPFDKAQCNVLSQLAPTYDVKERRRLLPYVTAARLPSPIDG